MQGQSAAQSIQALENRAHYVQTGITDKGSYGFDPRCVARALIETRSISGAATKLGCSPAYIRNHHENLIKAARQNGVIRTRT